MRGREVAGDFHMHELARVALLLKFLIWLIVCFCGHQDESAQSRYIQSDDQVLIHFRPCG